MPEKCKALDFYLKSALTPLKKTAYFFQKQSKTKPIVPSLFLS
jgi:hypothetical protein